MNPVTIRKKLLAWYRKNGRCLPWRGAADPYKVWISEVMLQQTQVETVIPYYVSWMERFPDLTALAAAEEQDVLMKWEGLGYYTRARNILRCARVLDQDFGGKLPEDIDKLKTLPGIGTYIAGAIASIAFQIKAPALDGNLKRVLTRLTEFRLQVNDEKNARVLRVLLMELLPDIKPGDFNQAFMDLGAMICLPRSPLCESCPLTVECMAYQKGCQNELPVKTKKAKNPHYQVVAAVMRNDTKVLIDKRNARGLLGGLWEFPGGKVEDGESLTEALRREISEELGVKIEIGESLASYKHAYTHYKVTVHSFNARILEGNPHAKQSEQIEWVDISRLGDYPMGKVDRLISLDLQNITAKP
ncbi:MAG: A/G-specific adenine glycosylase [Anaerolineaceae bacterium]|nr:A/G-specific adenine glycosylase [Anaerolineaceae bacterium]